MYRSVLLPLDGSQFGEHALQLATMLVRRSGAKLYLVHVHNSNSEGETWEPVTPFRFQDLEKSEREWDSSDFNGEEEYLSAQAKQLATDLNGSASCKVIRGPVVQALEHEIDETNPDLVVMATHGRGGFSRAWLGSVADALVRNIHKPILLVRAQGDDEPPQAVKTDKVLIALDGSRLAESIIPHALSLGEGSASTYTLLRVVPPFLADRVYGLVARVRYRLFGKFDMCRVPTAAERERFTDAGP